MLDGITDVGWFKEKDNSIKNNPAYKNQLLQQQKLFLLNKIKKQNTMRSFRHGDTNYWNKTINDLKAKSKVTNSGRRNESKIACLFIIGILFYQQPTYQQQSK